MTRRLMPLSTLANLRPGYSVRLALFVAALSLTLTACGPNVDLPPLPEIDTSELLTDVAAQLDRGRKAVDKNPKNGTTVGRYGLVLATYGRDYAADVAFQRARLLSPDKPRWAFYHSFVLRRMGKTEEALAAAQAGLALSPGQIDLVVKRGELLFDLGRFDEAETDFDTALAENPVYPLAQFYKGRIHMQRKQWQEAAARFEKMIEESIRGNEIHFNLATAYRMLGEADKSAQQLKLSEGGAQIKIAGYDPVNMKFDELNVGDQPHTLRAAQHYHSGNIDKAIEELLNAYEKNPKNVGTHANLVRMYGQSRQLDKAVFHYEAGKEIDPNFGQLASNIGFAYQTAGEYDKAAVAYAEAVEQQPDNAALHAELGFALGKSGRLDEGVEHLKKSLELRPVNRDLRYVLAEAMVKQRQLPDAIRMFQSALTPEDPKTIAVLRSLARAHVLSGNKESALESLENAVALAEKFDNQALVEALQSDIERVKFAATGN